MQQLSYFKKKYFAINYSFKKVSSTEKKNIKKKFCSFIKMFYKNFLTWYFSWFFSYHSPWTFKRPCILPCPRKSTWRYSAQKWGIFYEAHPLKFMKHELFLMTNGLAFFMIKLFFTAFCIVYIPDSLFWSVFLMVSAHIQIFFPTIIHSTIVV